MGIDPRMLSPAAQKQILGKVTAQKRGSKLHNIETVVQGADGKPHRFQSMREARRYKELQVLERAGAILNLRTQVSYELIPGNEKDDGKWERPCSYRADFDYWKVQPVTPHLTERELLKLYSTIQIADYKARGVRGPVLDGEVAYNDVHYGYRAGVWSAWTITHVVEDSKGYRNPSSAVYALFVVKRKLMLDRHGITIHEV